MASEGDVLSSLGELVRKDLIRPERGPGGMPSGSDMC